MWLAAMYEDEYVRIGREWKFKRLKFLTRFLASYEEGSARVGTNELIGGTGSLVHRANVQS
jgi:hypothetical protein